MPEESPTDDPWLYTCGELEEKTKHQNYLDKRKNSVNTYFLLDLRLPASPRHHGNTFPSALRTPYKSPRYSKVSSPSSTGSSSQTSSASNSLRKFGFLKLLEQIHNKDLTTNNPWLNPHADPRPDRSRDEREVRFTTTEMLSPELPHCRRDVGGMTVRPGQIHASSCPNAAHETVEVLGEHAWLNREFILENTKPREKSRVRSRLCGDHYENAERCDHRGNSDETESSGAYHKAETESLEELGVKDSLELTKRRLHLSNDPSKREGDFKSTNIQNEHTGEISPEFCCRNMVLDLASPGASDEDEITPASTVIQSVDSCYSDSVEDSVFSDSSPSSIRTERREGGEWTERASSFHSYVLNNANEFDMVATPSFRKGTSDYGSSGSDFRARPVDGAGDEETNLNFLRDKKPSTPYPTNVLQKKLEEETVQELQSLQNDESHLLYVEKWSIDDSSGDAGNSDSQKPNS